MKESNQNIKNKDKYPSYEINEDLKKLREVNPFIVPVNYFETLPGIIRDRKEAIIGENKRATSFNIYKLRPAYYLAAVFILLIAAALFIYNTRSSDNSVVLAELSWDEVVNDEYLVYTNLDVYNLIETLVYSSEDYNDNIITNTNGLTDETELMEIDSNLSSDDIIEYLLEEHMYTEEIYEL